MVVIIYLKSQMEPHAILLKPNWPAGWHPWVTKSLQRWTLPIFPLASFDLDPIQSQICFQSYRIFVLPRKRSAHSQGMEIVRIMTVILAKRFTCLQNFRLLLDVKPRHSVTDLWSLHYHCCSNDCNLQVAENRQGLWPSTWESQFWWIFKLHPYTSTIYQILAYKLRILNM